MGYDMKRYMTGFCWDCGKVTKQEVIGSKDSTGERIFEAVFTLGFALALPYKYECECTKCGYINTINK